MSQPEAREPARAGELRHGILGVVDALAQSVAWSTSCFLRNSRKMSARRTIISGPPTNSPRTNCQPRRSHMMIPSSMTRFVDAISKAIAAVKLAPWRNRERASATEA